MRLIKAARAYTDQLDAGRGGNSLRELIKAVEDYTGAPRRVARGAGLGPALKAAVACSSCGASIMFIRTPAGKNAPVDATPITGYDQDGSVLTIHLSHFATCPFAARHRKS